MRRSASQLHSLLPLALVASALIACSTAATTDGGSEASAQDGAADSAMRDAVSAVDAIGLRDTRGGTDVAAGADASIDADAARPDASAPVDAGDADATSGADGAPQTRVLPGGPAHLTFDDEFDSGTLDYGRWNRWYVTPAVINNELEFYAPDAFEFGAGTLRIRGERRAMYGFEYTSGAITTFGSFRQSYGYFEMQARVPKGNGLWPAFWMLAADQKWPPEIDVLEALGQDPNTAYLTYHWKDSAGAHQSDGIGYTAGDFTAGMHTYAVDWRPGAIVWYVDGVERHRVEGDQVTATPMYLLANLAIGGSWPVAPDSTTPFPAYYEIDYVRAYQYDAIAPGTQLAMQYGITQADTYVAAPGATVNFDLHVQVNQPPSDGMIVQAILYDNSLQNMVTSQVFMVPSPVPAGVLHERFAASLPGNLAPGIYRLSVGLFHQDWSFIDWLADASVITVQ